MNVLRSRLFAVCAAGVIAAIVIGGIAWAAVPSSDSAEITACYRTAAPDKGAVRVIDRESGRACRANEAMLTWPSRGLHWRGSWSNTTSYAPDDAVAYLGSSFVARVLNQGSPPSPGRTWALLAGGGASGSTGPQGATGDTGPPGITNVSVITGSTVASDGNSSSFSATATCTGTDTVISGGYQMSGGSPSGVEITRSAPSGNAWLVTLQTDLSSVQFHAYAICATVGS